MKINIKEKFDIVERLEALSIELAEHAESKALCDKGIFEFKKNVTGSSVQSFVKALGTYEWIGVIEEFVTEYNGFVKENQVGLHLEHILNTLESGAHSSTYSAAIDALTNIVPLDESDIKDELHRLDTFKFVPSIRVFLESYEKQAFAVAKSGKAEVEKDHISPVMMTESGYVFNLNGKNYEVDTEMTDIKAYEGKLSHEYQFAINALNSFTYEGAKGFVLPTKTGTISIISTEEGANRFFINEDEFFGKESIKSALTVTKAVDYFDAKTKSMIEFMYENADTIANIEIVKNIKSISEGLVMSFIKLANNRIVMNKVNMFERRNELIDITSDNIDEVKESFISDLNLDISGVLESISVNVKALKFSKLVSELDVTSIVENSSVLFSNVNVCVTMLDSFTDEDKESLKDDITVLEGIKTLTESVKVSTVLENKAKFTAEDCEVEGKDLVIEMLNEQLTELVKVSE